MDIAKLNRRYDWLWTRLENLFEARLRQLRKRQDTDHQPAADQSTRTGQPAVAADVRRRTTTERTTDNGQPTTDNRQRTMRRKAAIAAAAKQQRATDNQESATNDQQPGTDNQQPATNDEQPAADNDQPATENKQLSMRELYYAAQTLKRIYDGRRVMLFGVKNGPVSQRPQRPSQAAANDLSQRIQAVLRRGTEK